MRLIKILVGLLVLAFAGLAGYAYFGDMAPRTSEMRQPVALDLDAPAAAAARDEHTTPAPQTEPEAPADAATLD